MAKMVLSRRAIVGAAGSGALAAASGESALAAEAILSGAVFYRERMAPPPGAMLEVQLVDVSLADAPARVIAETRVPAGAGGRMRYRLRYDRAAILPRRRYALQARITAGERLLFVTMTHHPVFAGGRNRTDILVQRVGADGPPPPPARTPAGKWLAEDIGGGGVIDRLQTVLDIAPDGAVSGSGGCNRIAGRAEISGESISFGRLVSTRMACAPAAMNQEQRFLSALENARRWRIDSARGKLFLLDAGGAAVAVLARM